MQEQKRNILDYSVFISSGFIVIFSIIQYIIDKQGYTLAGSALWIYGIIISLIILFAGVGVTLRDDYKFPAASVLCYVIAGLFFVDIFSEYILLAIAMLIGALFVASTLEYHKTLKAFLLVLAVGFMGFTVLMMGLQMYFTMNRVEVVTDVQYSPSGNYSITALQYDDEHSAVFVAKVVEDIPLGMFGTLTQDGYGIEVGFSEYKDYPTISVTDDALYSLEWHVPEE